MGTRSSEGKALFLNINLETGSSRKRAVRGAGRLSCWGGRRATTDQSRGAELSRDSRGAGGCMLCRAGRVPTGGARNPVGTGALEADERVAAAAVGAVEADERVAAAAVGAVEAPTAAGCGTGGATNVTVVAEAGVGSENTERKEAWRRFSAMRAAAVARSWVWIAATRAWHSRSSV